MLKQNHFMDPKQYTLLLFHSKIRSTVLHHLGQYHVNITEHFHQDKPNEERILTGIFHFPEVVWWGSTVKQFFWDILISKRPKWVIDYITVQRKRAFIHIICIYALFLPFFFFSQKESETYVHRTEHFLLEKAFTIHTSIFIEQKCINKWNYGEKKQPSVKLRAKCHVHCWANVRWVIKGSF